MSKKKNKEKSELEHLRGENRRLRKQLNYYKKQANMSESDVYEEEAEEEVCEHCGKGQLEVIDLKYVIMEVCNVCGHQRKRK